MYSRRNKEKPAVSERFIRTLKNKIQKYRNSIPKIMYIKYNNTHHSQIKIKPADVKLRTQINFGKEFPKKFYLANLKLNGDDLVVGKLKTVPVKLSKLSKK